MVFSSTIFLFYFLPVFLVLYFITPHKYKNYTALAASLLFYAWGAPDFIFIVLASIFADFFLVKEMYKSVGKRRTFYVTASVVLNIGLLAYFKYANFFVDNLNEVLTAIGFTHFSWTKVALPIGISFFTFQKFTYTIDVYRGLYKPLEKVTDLCLYILLFPQLIAGPIVRYSEIAEQLQDRRINETVENRIQGLYRFILGLSKKVLIANVMGEVADEVFNMPINDITSGTAWIGILAYTFQIYFDFSGYSDMAIGLGKMIGFRFPENFNNPYISQSISEFWRRWHITLGRWMKDYLYIPLGGNKVGTATRLYFNLWLVFLISGLWHGASWTFVVWGAYHGLFLILDRIYLLKILKRIGKFPAIFLTFLATIVGWVLFRSETIEYAYYYTIQLFLFNFTETIVISQKFIIILVIAVFFSFFTISALGRKIEQLVYFKEYRTQTYYLLGIICMILLIVSSASISASGFNPFIYFRF
jgi:alginate O-acetyltransferase complex protein AlgI